MSPKQGRPFENKAKRERFEIRLSQEEERMLDFCTSNYAISRAEVIRQGISKMYYDAYGDYCSEDVSATKLKISISCPICDANNRISIGDYEVQSIPYDKGENGMGDEIEHRIECSDFECASCKRQFSFCGSVWEYPIGTVTCKTMEIK